MNRFRPIGLLLALFAFMVSPVRADLALTRVDYADRVQAIGTG